MKKVTGFSVLRGVSPEGEELIEKAVDIAEAALEERLFQLQHKDFACYQDARGQYAWVVYLVGRLDDVGRQMDHIAALPETADAEEIKLQLKMLKELWVKLIAYAMAAAEGLNTNGDV